MVDLSASQGLAARKEGWWGLKSFGLTACLNK